MKRTTVTSLVALAVAACISPRASASGFIVVDPVAGAPATTIAMMPPTRPPVPPVVRPPARPPVTPPITRPATPGRPVLKGSVSFGLHLQSESVKVDINDQVAKTYICQTFINNTDQNLAGTYLFPLPDDTTFSSFSLHIDGKPVEGKILEAQEARQQYEEIVRRMVDPGLLEYADYKTVRARIFPIPAHGTKKVELEYTQVLRAENGMLKYRFPLKVEGAGTPVDEIKVDVKLASSQGLRTIWSPSHTVQTDRSDDHRAKISLLQHDTHPDKDFLLYYSVSDKELAANLLTHKDEGEYGYFLMTLTPPVESKQVVAKDIVLVADTSGSMQGEKLEQCKKALKHVVNALGSSDRFNLVQFNTDVEKFRSSLVLASPENKKAALAFIDDLEAHGGTNIGGALAAGKALLSQPSERPAYLVFMTDGEPTVGETDIGRLVKSAANSRDIRIFDFGVGYDVNTRLLNKLAEENHGTAQYVEPDEDIETSVSNFYKKIKSPVLSNVGIAYEGVQVKDIYPKEVKDIFAGSQVILIGKYKGSGKATVRLNGKVNGVAKAFSFPLTFDSSATGHTYLPRLWAMRRIGYLTDVAQENGNNREVIDEIVALSKKYGIISAYTSFLVTDPSENARLARDNARMRPLPMPAPVVSMATRAQMAAGGGGLAGSFPGGMAMAPPASAGAGAGRRGIRMYRAAQQVKITDSRPAVLTGTAASLPEPAVPAPPPISAQSSASFFSSAGGIASANQATGKAAVTRSKAVNEYKWTVTAEKDEDKSAGVKSVEDKTFYMIDGFWTDSTYEAGKSPKPEAVTFGSQRYFELIRTVAGISKYLAVGKKVIVVFKGHVYKIVESAQG